MKDVFPSGDSSKKFKIAEGQWYRYAPSYVSPAYHLLEGFPWIQEPPSGDLQERVLIRHHDYDFFFSSRRRHTRCSRDWSSDVCSSDLSGALAQVAPNNATLYLHPTDVSDARALWVNPAGLGHFPEASVHLDLTVGDPGAKGQLRQLTLGLNSRGLSLGYQRDLFSSGRRGHTYKLGYAAGRGGLAAGFATALYRGGTSGTGWDVGILYDWTPALSIGGGVPDIGPTGGRASAPRLPYGPNRTLQLARPPGVPS